MIKTKKQMYLVIGAFALVMLLGGVTYAFFNYTRTGTANTIRVGRISFNTSQSNTLNLTNVFPMSATDAGNANLDAVSVRIWGDTTYSDGEEFEISIVDVNNTIGSGQSAKTIPINYIASYSATPVQSGDPNVIGTNSDSYFTARGQSSPVYQLNATGEATNGEQVLIGFIPSGATGIDGTLTIKAYLDSSKIAISDTYNASDPETDTNGTTTDWVAGRTVLTTSEWNALQNTQTPLSFKIKAVSQEGTWVTNSNGTNSSSEEDIFICPTSQCVYGITEGAIGEQLDGNIGDDFYDFHTDYSVFPDWFFAYALNNDSEVEQIYVCTYGTGTYDNRGENLYCLRGGVDESSDDERPIFNDNMTKAHNACVSVYGFEGCDNTDNSKYDDDNDWYHGHVGRSFTIYPNGNMEFGDGDYGISSGQSWQSSY